MSAALVVTALLAVWLVPTGAGAATQLNVTADQGLYPAFNPAIHDYVIRCTGAPVQITATIPFSYGVSVDGSSMMASSFTRSVPLATGQEFSFSVRHSEVTTPYYVRCLPQDFTHYTFTPEGSSPYGMFAIDGALGHYTAVLDSNGVPIWWMRTSAGAGDSQVLADGTYGFYDMGAGVDEIYSLSGQPIRSLVAEHGSTDQHELLLLENGDYMIDSYVQRSGVDLSQFGGPSNTTVLDGEAEEITKTGQVVWFWNSGQHTSLNDTPQAWFNRQSSFGAPYDIFHLNAIQPYGPGGSEVLISARHTDAVWGIDKSTGNVLWKLGGTPNPASLTMVGDPQGSYPFGGQHDVRAWPDGTISVHDNNYGQTSRPRVVSFTVNPSNHTANYVSSFGDPAVSSALCCGSARKLPGGQWLVSWGYNPLVAEYSSTGTQLWSLTFSSSFSYRAIPVPPQVSITSLRAGMNTQYPRPVGGASKLPGASFTASTARASVGTAVRLDGTAGASAAAGAVSYRWDFGDGHSASGVRVSHSYRHPGLYLVRLTVRDRGGASHTISRTITVLEGAAVAPKARFEAPASARTGRGVAFDGSYSLATHATLVSYRWRFGDGKTASGEMVSHTFRRAGKYRVSLTVRTSAGTSNTRTETIRVR